MFQQLYYLLFNRITDALEALESGNVARAKSILIRAQQDAEERYIESGVIRETENLEF